MNARDRYNLWTTQPRFDAATREELLRIAEDPAEIEDRFYRSLEFGTAGLRGVIGAGTNRMNVYTVAMAAAGFARDIASKGQAAMDAGVVISFDSRRMSPEFARVVACVFAAHGVLARLSDTLRPVPVLSFAIRHYLAAGGVMITASHNPAAYNGFKAYGSDGGQCPPETADQIAARMGEIEDPTTIEMGSYNEHLTSGRLVVIGEELDDAYMEMLSHLALHRDAVARHADMKIVYTPLHGSGNVPVRRILAESGFRQVLVVPEQELPDPDFPTVKAPNPEERAALSRAITLAEREQADLVIATDPDADRMGLALRGADGEYTVLTGNQIGLLLMDYILSSKQAAGTLPDRSFCVTTIVSTKLAKRVASHYSVTLMECLTGFKYIGELIKEHDENGNMHFQFGFEESFGFLSGTDVRDKDAVVAAMLAAEMAAVARDRGMTLYDWLQDLFRRFGHAAEKTLSISLDSREGLDRIRKGMERLRSSKSDRTAGLHVSRVKDYLQSVETDFTDAGERPLDLPRSDVLLYELDDLDWFCVRPSGTEPKIKIYAGAYDADATACAARLSSMVDALRDHMEEMLRP